MANVPSKILILMLMSYAGAYNDDFSFQQCNLKNNLERDAAFPSMSNIKTINLKVTHHVTHQIITRIFAIFLRKIMKYENELFIQQYNLPSEWERSENWTEKIVEYSNINTLHMDEQSITLALNLEVWRTADHQVMFPESIIEGNSLSEEDIARYGLYIPTKLINRQSKEKFHFDMFSPESSSYDLNIVNQFSAEAKINGFLERVVKDDITSKQYEVIKGIYKPKHCYSQSEKCALVLTSYYTDTNFFLRHIEKFRLKMIVYFVGDLLKETIQNLSKLILVEKLSKKFLVLHWTPSEIIDGSIEFDEIIMPKCEDYKNENTSCKFEANSMAIFFNKVLADSNLLEIVQNVKFKSLKTIIKDYYEPRYNQKLKNIYRIKAIESDIFKITEYEKEIEEEYNKIACSWLKNNTYVYIGDQKWFNFVEAIKVELGAIIPPQNTSEEYNGISAALEIASREFNDFDFFPNYKFEITQYKTECRSDKVLNKFIHYFAKRKSLIGVLGPSCTSAIEPIAAISKHYGLSVITYSAEGIVFDRENFPYFYRTIGSNQQYEDVFAKLFAHYKWKRIAAITEDGQKYTEYISRMDSSNNSFKLTNRKFTHKKTNESQLQPDFFKKLLKELKSSNHHIIIADFQDDELMKLLMCTASKLKMTAQNGYVWFLPVFMSIRMNETEVMNNNQSCTAGELKEVLKNHFALSYANFGNDDTILPSNRTVSDWKNEYMRTRNINTISPADYAPFVYDAVWVYAKTLMQLIKEDSSDSIPSRSKPKYWYINNLESDDTLKRMVQIFETIDFHGVSGRIQFNNVGSRYTNVYILQWLNNDFKFVGTYTPEIFNKTIINGNLKLKGVIFETEIDDGSETCMLEFLADALNTDCHTINSILIAISCVTIILACSGLSFLFWKHKYAKKLEKSAQIFKDYGRVVNGIELSKWEIPRENIIINRRIGEGQFGTVYGGEALIKNESNWMPVAIKTLKVGNSPEQRLDFLAESEIMKRFDHKNIVKLLAVCLTQNGPLLACMEFMLYGDLKTYLLSRRHLVNDKVNEESNDISPKRLTLMALDVARGLSYLASLSFVHRDIALRNCLINAQRIVKIGDFGMCRSTCENDYYRFTRKGMLPIRWMAPESVDGGVFSHATDVWSFGVFLYEVITLGGFPFQGLTNNQVFELVKSGESIKIPQESKPPCKALMSSCFSLDPKKRPGASTIVEFISNYPRMLSPCMSDIPKPNLDEQVNLIDADINEDFEFDQLIENRERSHTPAITIDFLRPSASSSALQNNTRSQEFEYLDMKLPKRMNGGIYNYSPDLTATLPNGGGNYNPVEPLLINPRSTEISKSTLSLLNKYVPMCGFNKNKNRSSPDECATSAL
ncbi:hypothetical protein PVAND_005641 [Polypedilum vanderplanki]|uniref:Protein kinase domain-containing protein n=1 Tax=Polypedilum vanderplanki TaxID=319348 RepID=A0A9J6C0S5_POLVA|nr:hypothetical protein PVAND_005641 [Polypedilum vanderplanki]